MLRLYVPKDYMLKIKGEIIFRAFLTQIYFELKNMWDLQSKTKDLDASRLKRTLIIQNEELTFRALL